MPNSLITLNVGHVGHPFRLSLMCVCARMYARISELYGSLVPHVPPLFGSSLGRMPFGGDSEPRRFSLFKFSDSRGVRL